MEVIVGKLAGFCAGVQNAVVKAKETCEKYDNVYCLGEIVHNREVVTELENLGMKTVEDINEIPNDSVVIFRAHGVTKEIYEIAESKNLNVIDLTCVKVLDVHNKIDKESENAFVILIGDKNHPEVIGSVSFARNGYYVVSEESDILDAYVEYEKNMIGEVKVFAQTTFKLTKFDELVEEINSNFVEANVEVFNTICMATSLRQTEMIKMSEELDNMIIIGGKNSANTKKLVDISKEKCANVYHVQTVEDLKEIDFSGITKIGIMAGASTPKSSIEGVREYLEKL